MVVPQSCDVQGANSMTCRNAFWIAPWGLELPRLEIGHSPLITQIHAALGLGGLCKAKFQHPHKTFPSPEWPSVRFFLSISMLPHVAVPIWGGSGSSYVSLGTMFSLQCRSLVPCWAFSFKTSFTQCAAQATYTIYSTYSAPTTQHLFHTDCSRTFQELAVSYQCPAQIRSV